MEKHRQTMIQLEVTWPVLRHDSKAARWLENEKNLTLGFL